MRVSLQQRTQRSILPSRRAHHLNLLPLRASSSDRDIDLSSRTRIPDAPPVFAPPPPPPPPPPPEAPPFGGQPIPFWGYVAGLAAGSAMLWVVYDTVGPDVKVDQYIANADVIAAQRASKEAKKRGEAPMNDVDAYMMDAPDIKAQYSFKVKTKGKHSAYYFEDEYGKPWMIDENNNLWLYAGLDANDPEDDWLVRTPSGEIYNFYMNEDNQPTQMLLGNERDLKVLPNTNLGTIIGFANELALGDEKSDADYRVIPDEALDIARDDLTGKEVRLPPPLLEEGFIEFKKKPNPLFPFFGSNKAVPTEEIEKAVAKGEKFQSKGQPFSTTIDIDEEEYMEGMQKAGLITQREKESFLAQRQRDADSIEADAEQTDLDANALPSAVDYGAAAEGAAVMGKRENYGYVPGDIARDEEATLQGQLDDIKTLGK